MESSLRRRRVVLAASAVLALAGLAALADCTGAGRSGAAGQTAQRPVAVRTPAHTMTAPKDVGAAIYPTAGSRTASPKTQISLRGPAASAIGTIRVTGSVSGRHAGTLKPDSDGKGASFYPTKPFTPGERVTVSTGLHLVGGTGSHDGTIHFTVSRPISESLNGPKEKINLADVQHFVSAPGLQPPKLSVQVNSLPAGAGDIFLAPKNGSGGDGPMITTPAGRLVWFQPLPDGLRAYDFRAQTYLGKQVLTWWQGYGTKTGHGGGTDYIYDDHYRLVAAVHAGNGYRADMHDFTLTQDNTALLTAYQAIRWNLSSVGGSSNGIAIDSIFQEIDIPTGNVIAEWHALDHVPVSDSVTAYAQGQPFDYFHINTLTSDGKGHVLVSGRSVSAVFDVDEASGRIIWQLGGAGSDFHGDGTQFQVQHDVRWVDAHTIMMFDNVHTGNATTRHSRMLVISLNTAKHTAKVTRNLTDLAVPWANSQGSVQRLPDGNVFIGWGSQPYVSELSASGKVLYRARLSDSNTSYRAFESTWHAQPTTPPAVAATVSGSTTSVYASWNGATTVASWRVLTGSTASALTPGSTVKAGGFETAIKVAGRPAYVQVQALDASGGVLGTSAAVAVTP